MDQESDLDFCPNCGHHANLVEETGWCPQCTVHHYPDLKLCTCGAFFKRNAQADKCWPCRKEEWLEKHADEVEEYLLAGFSLESAKKKVADDIRPICHSCEEPIKGGGRDVLFCNKKPECIKASNSYSALKATGLTPDVALDIALGKAAVLC
jgi:hypothetical protein